MILICYFIHFHQTATKMFFQKCTFCVPWKKTYGLTELELGLGIDSDVPIRFDLQALDFLDYIQ